MIDLTNQTFQLSYTKWNAVKLPEEQRGLCPICKTRKGNMGLTQAQQDEQTNIRPVKAFHICDECLVIIMKDNSEIQTFVEYEVVFVFFNEAGDASESFVFVERKSSC